MYKHFNKKDINEWSMVFWLFFTLQDIRYDVEMPLIYIWFYWWLIFKHIANT